MRKIDEKFPKDFTTLARYNKLATWIWNDGNPIDYLWEEFTKITTFTCIEQCAFGDGEKCVNCKKELKC